MQVLNTYIVEDNRVIRDSLIATLEELAPVKVVGTADGEADALQWLTHVTFPVDLVIVDLFLKTGSGVGLLRSVRHLPHLRRVVVLSNYATADMRRKCLELGAHRVFDKSNEIDALMAYCNAIGMGETDSANIPLTP